MVNRYKCFSAISYSHPQDSPQNVKSLLIALYGVKSLSTVPRAVRHPSLSWIISNTTLSSQATIWIVGRDRVGNIATHYRLDGPGIESRWGWDFPQPSRPALGPTQPPIQWIPGLFSGDKAAGVWRGPPTPSSAAVKERVELYFYSPFGPSRPVLGRNLPFTLSYDFNFQTKKRSILTESTHRVH
jgi:hypothetical protein